VGAFALFDLTHLVEDILENLPIWITGRSKSMIGNARHTLPGAQKKAGGKVRKEYDQICETDAQNMVGKVRQGDLSFGADEMRGMPLVPR